MAEKAQITCGDSFQPLPAFEIQRPNSIWFETALTHFNEKGNFFLSFSLSLWLLTSPMIFSTNTARWQWHGWTLSTVSIRSVVHLNMACRPLQTRHDRCGDSFRASTTLIFSTPPVGQFKPDLGWIGLPWLAQASFWDHTRLVDLEEVGYHPLIYTVPDLRSSFQVYPLF